MRMVRWRVRPSHPVSRTLVSTTGRLCLIAAGISAAKIGLFAIGSSALLEASGIADLPMFYLGLAGTAGLIALALAAQAQKRHPIDVLAVILIGIAAFAACIPPMLALGRPGAIALLSAAHLFNIVTEILLWLVAARWLPPPELRRVTMWVFLAYSFGGLIGGIATHALLEFGAGIACGSVAMGGALVALAVTSWSRRSPHRGGARLELPPAETDPASMVAALVQFRRIARDYPLVLLLAASSFMMTLVYVLTEYLCFAVYAERVGDRQATAAFFTNLYAWAQALEFLVVLIAAGPVTRRLSPLVRNILFPLGSLVTLIGLVHARGTVTAVVAHLHTEAVSNGLFDPVHNANFVVLPVQHHPPVRAVTEGLAYPAGMAAGGLVLLAAESNGLQLIEATAQGVALMFVMVGIAIGVQLVPTLLLALGRFTEQRGPYDRRAIARAARALSGSARRCAARLALLEGLRDPARSARLKATNRAALDRALQQAAALDPSGTIRILADRLEHDDPDVRALAVEGLFSLPVRPIFTPFLPVLRTCYLPGSGPAADDLDRGLPRADAPIAPFSPRSS